MRNLLIFMAVAGIFVLGARTCHISPFHFGNGINGSGPSETQTRSVSGFHGISLEVSGEVEVRVADTYSVEVTAQQNVLPILQTEVENGSLRIYFSENVSNVESIKVVVSGPMFDDLAIAGSGTIRVVTPIKSDKMDCSIAGSGDIVLAQSEFGVVKCDIAGSGSIELGGRANELKANIAGSGDVKAKSMTTNILDAEISGSGSVSADVSQTLKASIAGSGDVYYSGQPSVDADISGSGKVKKM